MTEPMPPQPGPSAYQRPPDPPPAPWQRRQRWGTAGVAIGAMVIIAALLIDFKWYSAGSVSRLNGLCSSGFGQLAQAGSSRAAAGCSQAALLDHLVGWGIIAGVLAIVAGVAARVSAGHMRAGLAGAPPAAGPGTPPGPPPGSYPVQPPPAG